MIITYIPCSKLIFHVDNGLGTHLRATGLAAEYDIFNKKITWRRLSNNQLVNQKQLSHQLILLSSLVPSTLFIAIIFVIKMLSGGRNEVGLSGILGYTIPVILGFIMFLSFDYLMIQVRSKYEICSPPSSNEQLLYFEGVDKTALRFNDVWASNRIPYLANIIVSILVIGVVLPIMFWLYLIPSPVSEFIIKLIILGLIISLIPNIGWNLILKSIVLLRIKQSIKEKTNAR